MSWVLQTSTGPAHWEWLLVLEAGCLLLAWLAVAVAVVVAVESCPPLNQTLSLSLLAISAGRTQHAGTEDLAEQVDEKCPYGWVRWNDRAH